jgi:hypothetical protein
MAPRVGLAALVSRVFALGSNFVLIRSENISHFSIALWR